MWYTHLTGVRVVADDGGDERGDPHRVGAGVGVVLVQLDEMVDGKCDADNVDGDPEKVDDVMSEGSLDQRTGWLPGLVIDVSCHTPTKKCGAQVDCDAREPVKRNKTETAWHSSAHVNWTFWLWLCSSASH